MEKDKRRVYVAGKYTDDKLVDQLGNIAFAEGTGKILASYGIKTYVPHCATAMWDDVNDYDYFMDLHTSVLENWATDIYLLHNWKDSNGAKIEEELAKKLGINVWDNLDDLIYDITGDDSSYQEYLNDRW